MKVYILLGVYEWDGFETHEVIGVFKTEEGAIRERDALDGHWKVNPKKAPVGYVLNRYDGYLIEEQILSD